MMNKAKQQRVRKKKDSGKESPREEMRLKKHLNASTSEDPLGSAEDQQVAAFCASVKLEEVSLEKWQQSHKNLDIIYPLFLSSKECEEGCVRQIKFTRRKTADGEQQQREKMSVDVIVPMGAKNGDIISFESFGDCTDKQTGDLKVQIHRK